MKGNLKGCIKTQKQCFFRDIILSREKLTHSVYTWRDKLMSSIDLKRGMKFNALRTRYQQSFGTLLMPGCFYCCLLS